MTTRETDEITRRYLNRLHKELGDLPAVNRNEVLDEIRDHIADSRATVQSDADMLAVLSRLGDPKSIADDARERFGLTSYQAGTIEIAAIILLLFSFSVVGYIVGLVLVWRSPAWRRLDKLIGTLTPLLAVPAVWIAGARPFLLFALIVAPIYLAVRMRHRSRAVLLVSVIPLGLVIVASVGALIAGAGISSGNSYMVVNGRHVCWVGTSSDNEKQVACNSVPPPYGGWSDLEKNSFTTGYDYAIAVNGQHSCTVDTPKGIFQQTSCSSIPAPPGDGEPWQRLNNRPTVSATSRVACSVTAASPLVAPTPYPAP